jgi:hypothetical protein
MTKLVFHRVGKAPTKSDLLNKANTGDAKE